MSATVWKRRIALMAAVGLIVAIPATIVLRGGDDDADGGAPAELPQVGAVEFDRDLGIELRLPEGWKRREVKDAVTYESEDRTVLIAVSAPGPADDAAAIQAAALAGVKAKYDDVKVVARGDEGRLGRRPARTAVIAAGNPKNKQPLRILVSTARGENRAYLVEVFASGGEALGEAQALLNNLRLEG